MWMKLELAVSLSPPTRAGAQAAESRTPLLEICHSCCLSWSYFLRIFSHELTTDVCKRRLFPSSRKITIHSLSSALVTFVIIYLTCIMMRQVIYVRSVARLCCSAGVAWNCLYECTSLAVCARRAGFPHAVVHPGVRHVCRGVSLVLEQGLGFPAPVCPLHAMPWLASVL